MPLFLLISSVIIIQISVRVSQGYCVGRFKVRLPAKLLQSVFYITIFFPGILSIIEAGSLIESSPFLAPEEVAAVAHEEKPEYGNQMLEFAGVYMIGKEVMVNIRDAGSGEGDWLRIGEKMHNYILESYDADQDLILLADGTGLLRLKLKSPEPGTGNSLQGIGSNITGLSVTGREPAIAGMEPENLNNPEERGKADSGLIVNTALKGRRGGFLDHDKARNSPVMGVRSNSITVVDGPSSAGNARVAANALDPTAKIHFAPRNALHVGP